MHFDDSLFQQEDKAGSKRLEANKIKYSAKRCELNVRWLKLSIELAILNRKICHS